MKLAVATMVRGQPRFFTGRHDHAHAANGISSPITTGKPDRAHYYELREVADLVAELFNLFDGIAAGKPQRTWSVIELPEQWT